MNQVYTPENIADQDYPHELATGGLTDPRVTYWEPAKWAAKLRYHNTRDTKILCWINMEAGHGGGSGRFDRIKEVALSYGFALLVTGKAGRGGSISNPKKWRVSMSGTPSRSKDRHVFLFPFMVVSPISNVPKTPQLVYLS